MPAYIFHLSPSAGGRAVVITDADGSTVHTGTLGGDGTCTVDLPVGDYTARSGKSSSGGELVSPVDSDTWQSLIPSATSVLPAPLASPPEGAEGALWLVTDSPAVAGGGVLASFSYYETTWMRSYLVDWVGGVIEGDLAVTGGTPDRYVYVIDGVVVDEATGDIPPVAVGQAEGPWGDSVPAGRYSLVINTSDATEPGPYTFALPEGMTLAPASGGSLRWWDVDGEQWVKFPEPETGATATRVGDRLAAYTGTNLTIPSGGVGALLACDSLDETVGDSIALSVGGAVEFTAAGTYSLTASVEFDDNPTGLRRLRLSGLQSGEAPQQDAVGVRNLTLTCIYAAEAGDIWAVTAKQESATDLDAYASVQVVRLA